LEAARIAQSLERKGFQASRPYHLVDKGLATFNPFHLKILHYRIHYNCGI
jgi:hypothetical protein